MPKLINKNTTLKEVLDQNKENVLAKYNVPCLTCPMAKMEMNELKIGDICGIYGIDLKGLLEDLSK